MSNSDTAAPIHIPDDELVRWLDGLTKEQRAKVMLCERSFARVAEKWDQLTPEEKVRLYNAEPAARSGDSPDISDRRSALRVNVLHASDYEAEQPDTAVMDAEETRGIDLNHPYVIELANQRAAHTVFEVVSWLLSYGDKEIRDIKLHRRLDAADTKLVALAWILNAQDFGCAPLTRWAAEMGMTRAALSHAALQIRDRWHLFQRGQRSETARDAYADRQRKVWRKRPRQDSGTLIKNSKQREAVAAFLESNPEATTAEIRAALGGTARTVERIAAAWRENRTTPPPAAGGDPDEGTQ